MVGFIVEVGVHGYLPRGVCTVDTLVSPCKIYVAPRPLSCLFLCSQPPGEPLVCGVQSSSASCRPSPTAFKD